MGFTKITGVSKFWNPKDKEEVMPDPVVCDSFFDMTKAGAATNAELEIILHVWFEMHTTAMGKLMDGHKPPLPFDIRDWTPADDFPGWCLKVRDESNKVWDDKLILIPPKKYDGIDVDIGGTTYRSNVRCRFKLMIGTPSYHHCKVTVGIALPRADGEPFSARSRTWSIEKVNVKLVNTVVGIIGQVSCAHEIGHLMGLHHIGEVTKVKDCDMSTGKSTGSRANACYGTADSTPGIATNIMGAGMDVSEHNALPWQQEMCKHANRKEYIGLSPSDWTAQAGFLAPTVVPATPAGCSGPFH